MNELIFGLLNMLIATGFICGFFFGIVTAFQLLFEQPKNYWWKDLFPKDEDY